MKNVIYSCPAYDVVEAEKVDGNGAKHVVNEEVIAIPFKSKNHGTIYRMFTLGSVASYALKYNECPLKAVSMAHERGDAIFWANPNGVMITAEKQARKEYTLIEYGDTIYFQGHRFIVEKAANDNVELKLID